MNYHEDPDINWFLKTANAHDLCRDLDRCQDTIKKIFNLDKECFPHKNMALRRCYDIIDQMRNESAALQEEV